MLCRKNNYFIHLLFCCPSFIYWYEIFPIKLITCKIMPLPPCQKLTEKFNMIGRLWTVQKKPFHSRVHGSHAEWVCCLEKSTLEQRQIWTFFQIEKRDQNTSCVFISPTSQADHWEMMAGGILSMAANSVWHMLFFDLLGVQIKADEHIVFFFQAEKDNHFKTKVILLPKGCAVLLWFFLLTYSFNIFRWSGLNALYLLFTRLIIIYWILSTEQCNSTQEKVYSFDQKIQT